MRSSWHNALNEQGKCPAGTTSPDITKKPFTKKVSGFGDNPSGWGPLWIMPLLSLTRCLRGGSGGSHQIIITCTTSIRAPKPSTKPTMGSTNLTHWLNWMPSICRVTSTSPVGARNSMAYWPQL